VRPPLFYDWEVVTTEDLEDYEGHAVRTDGKPGFDCFAGLRPDFWVEPWVYTDEKPTYTFIVDGESQRADQKLAEEDSEDIILGERWPPPFKEEKVAERDYAGTSVIEFNITIAPQLRQNGTMKPKSGKRNAQKKHGGQDLRNVLSLKQHSYYGVGI
jgi:hypothetical protein